MPFTVTFVPGQRKKVFLEGVATLTPFTAVVSIFGLASLPAPGLGVGLGDDFANTVEHSTKARSTVWHVIIARNGYDAIVCKQTDWRSASSH